jgi:hypothetical protein
MVAAEHAGVKILALDPGNLTTSKTVDDEYDCE